MGKYPACETRRLKLTQNLYKLDGSLCALEYSSSLDEIVCPVCGRPRRVQISDLQVSLVCKRRKVWRTNGNALLIDSECVDVFPEEHREFVDFQATTVSWRSGAPFAEDFVPRLLQLRAKYPISAAAESVKGAGCTCGAVESISFKPLVVLKPGLDAGIWFLSQNPEVLIFNETIWDFLRGQDGDLEAMQVWWEGETPAVDRSEEISWADL